MSNTTSASSEMTGVPTQRWWSDKQVAAWLGCSWRHIRRMAELGELPSPRRIGRLVRWDSQELEAWAANRKSA